MRRGESEELFGAKRMFCGQIVLWRTITLNATALITADLVGGAISSFTKDVPILEKLQVRC